MKGHQFLNIPGPTNIPQRILSAMMKFGQEDMRSSEFPELTLPLFSDLKKLFKTKSGRVFIFPTTGTGGLEAAITNTLSHGDKVLMSYFGQFSYLWVSICRRHGLSVDAIESEWGFGVPVDKYYDILNADKEKKIKAVFVTHNETSTGVTSDIFAVRRALDDASHPAMLFVDGISSVASIDFRMDEWGVDVCVVGSQKGLMLPAGLCIICVSEKALEAVKTSTLPCSYFSFNDMKLENERGYFPYTPSTHLLRGLRESLNVLFEEGMQNVIKRHYRYANSVRIAVKAWGLSLVARKKELFSNTVTAIYVPEGFDSDEIARHAHKHYNLSLAIGLGKLSGSVFRIGHIGDQNDLMVMTPLLGAEMTMKDLGIPIELGSGVSAAARYLRSTIT